MQKVSIGLPVYNGERYLQKALDSILSQTYKDFELIISDNASEDRTREICLSYAREDERISYYRNKTNLGAAYNYNRVFELSTGEYYKWISHDDLHAPEYLDRCVDILDKYPDVVLCYHKTTIINDRGEKIYDHEDGLNLRSSLPHKRLHQFFHKPPGCNPVFGLMRANVLGETRLIGPYESSDYNLLVEMCLRGQFWEVPERLFFRRSHSQMFRRSTKVNRDFAVWFDTNYSGTNAFPILKLIFELIKSIINAQMNRYEIFLCLVELFKSAFVLSLRALEWNCARSDQSRLY